MAVEMKEIIAEAAWTLLFEKKVKKLTIKDIVEECHITRQAFYYHFEDIPDLMRWQLKQGARKLMEECLKKQDLESGLRYLTAVAVSVKPYVERGIQTNYGTEMEQLIEEAVYELAERIAEKEHLYESVSHKDLRLILKFHVHGMMGILKEWTPEDTKQMDHIVHEIYLLMNGKITRFSEKES